MAWAKPAEPPKPRRTVTCREKSCRVRPVAVAVSAILCPWLRVCWIPGWVKIREGIKDVYTWTALSSWFSFPRFQGVPSIFHGPGSSGDKIRIPPSPVHTHVFGSFLFCPPPSARRCIAINSACLVIFWSDKSELNPDILAALQLGITVNPFMRHCPKAGDLVLI